MTRKPPHSFSSRGSLWSEPTGAIIVEQLIVFLPVLFFVLVTSQVIQLCTGAILLRHAAFCAARAAVVVLPDDPRRYGGEAFIKAGDSIPAKSSRVDAVRKAAKMLLQTDRHFDTTKLTVTLSIDSSKNELSANLTAPYQCFARFVNVTCLGREAVELKAEGLDAYQGAAYAY